MELKYEPFSRIYRVTTQILVNVVFFSGKWFNYGIIFIVMLMDLNMWKNQIFYKPFTYGQYQGPNSKLKNIQTSHFIIRLELILIINYFFYFLNPLKLDKLQTVPINVTVSKLDG